MAERARLVAVPTPEPEPDTGATRFIPTGSHLLDLVLGGSLEWATSCPPPRHNFVSIPRIRSERPAFEYHYPHLLQRLEEEAHSGGIVHTVPSMAGAVSSEGGSGGKRDPEPKS